MNIPRQNFLALFAALLSLGLYNHAADAQTPAPPIAKFAPMSAIDAAKYSLKNAESRAKRDPIEIGTVLLRLGDAFESKPETASEALQYYDRGWKMLRGAPVDSKVPEIIQREANRYVPKNRVLAKELYLFAIDTANRVGSTDFGPAYEAAMAFGKFAKTDATVCPQADAIIVKIQHDLQAVKPGDAKMTALLEMRGELNLKIGKLEDALALFHQAIDNDTASGSQASQTLQHLQEDIIYVHYRSGNYREAERILQELDQRLKQSHKPGILETPTNATTQISRLCRDGKIEEALAFARQDLATLQSALKPYPTGIAVAKGRIADILHSQKKYDEAESLYLEIIEASKGGNPPQSLMTAAWQSDLGQLYRAKSDYAKALEYQMPACDLFQRTYENEYPDVIHCKSELAFLYAATGQNDKAENRYRELLAFAQGQSPKDEVMVSGYGWALADVLTAEKKESEAESTYQSIVAVWEAYKTVPQLRESLTRLQDFYRKTHNVNQVALIAKRIAGLPKK